MFIFNTPFLFIDILNSKTIEDYSFYFDGGLLPLPPPDGLPVVDGALTDIFLIFYSFIFKIIRI